MLRISSLSLADREFMDVFHNVAVPDAGAPMRLRMG
jgi:hypothetical protein